MVEDVAMGMLDLAERLERGELEDVLIEEAEHTRIRYETLWQALHAEPVFGVTDRYRVEGTIRRLNDLASPSTKSRCKIPSAATRVSSDFMWPLVIGAITRTACRTRGPGSRRGSGAHPARGTCVPTRRSCVREVGQEHQRGGPRPALGHERY